MTNNLTLSNPSVIQQVQKNTPLAVRFSHTKGHMV
jgi:hypothetical protein